MGHRSKSHSVSVYDSSSLDEDSSGIELKERKSLLKESTNEEPKDIQDQEIAHNLMSLLDFDQSVTKYSVKWEIDEAEVESTKQLLHSFYNTFHTPSRHHPLELDSLRATRLIALYKYLSQLEDIQAPFKTLKNQCDSIIRIYLQIPPDANLHHAIETWEAKKVFKPNLVGPLPELTSSAHDLDDHVKLDELLKQEEEETSLSRQEQIRQIVGRITAQNPDNVTEEQYKKLINMAKERRYRQYLQPKKILDLFKKGTYGVVGAKYQHQLNENGWHLCDEKEREDYRVFADFNHPQLLQQKTEGEGDNRRLSFAVVTTENKKAFVDHPGSSYFDDTGIFVIDADGRMYLFSADDHEDGLTPASVMKCEPVLFAGRLKTLEGEFELHSSSKEYKTNQRMSMLAVHYLATQARVLPENAKVNSAPVLRTEPAKIISQASTPNKIELAKTQPLNISIYSENHDGKIYSEHEGLYWHLRPDAIFPTNGTILDEDYHLDDEERTELINTYKSIKAYIAARFNLPSANAVWQISSDEFNQLLLELNDSGEAKMLRDENGEPIILSSAGISTSQRENLEKYYWMRQQGKRADSQEFLNTELVQKVYNTMFDNEAIKIAFEKAAKEKGFSNKDLHAIWTVGGKAEFKLFMNRLLENHNLLTTEEYDDFKTRANAVGTTVKAGKFDGLISSNVLPEEAPKHFNEDEFLAVTEAHELVQSRKDWLTQYYYSRRQISSTPEQNLAHFMYGEIYANCKKHPWYKDRIGPYLAFVVAGVVLFLILTSIILFAPELLALTICCVANFFTIVFVGYLTGVTVGGLLGAAVAFVTDILLEPKPVQVPEKIYDYERSRFYRIADDQQVSTEADESIFDEDELMVSNSV